MAVHPSQKLAVILHADVVGSTALVRKDERVAHDRIQAAFQAFAGTVRRYRGAATEIRGDALVAEFSRASDAVLAALAAQEGNANLNADLNDEISPELRVGIALGEVVVADETVTGAGVVLAQRLEQLAAPGGVCISGAIREAVPDRLPLDYESLGEQEVKGFDEAVRAYAVTLQSGEEIPVPEPGAHDEKPAGPASRPWTAAGIIAVVIVVIAVIAWWRPWWPDFEPASVERMALPLPDKPSIIVLPFDNLSGDPEQDHLADGLTEELTTTISRIPQLFIIARNSAFTYKGKAVSVKQVAEEQGVRYILEGSVRRSGDRIRVNAQLIDALKGTHLWAERYDREFDDLLALQDDITGQVAVALQVRLTEVGAGQLHRRDKLSPEAFLLTYKAIWHHRQFNEQDEANAWQLIKRAQGISPDAITPLQMEGWIHLMYARFGWGRSRDESLQEAEAIAEHLLKVADRDAGTYFLLAGVRRGQRKLDEAVRYAQRAVELNPNHVGALGTLGQILNYAGRPKEAIAPVKTAMRLSPIYPAFMQANLGLSYMMLGDYDRAIEAYEAVLSRKAMVLFSYERLCAIYALKGDMEKAREYAAKVLETKPSFTIRGWSKALFYKNQADLERELNALRMAGLPE